MRMAGARFWAWKLACPKPIPIWTEFLRRLTNRGLCGLKLVVSAFMATAFAQETSEAASSQWHNVAGQIRPQVPKLAAIMDDAEEDVLAYMTFPKEHRAKLHSTNLIERLNGEIKRRTEVVCIYPNDDALVRLVGHCCSSKTMNGPSSMPRT